MPDTGSGRTVSVWMPDVETPPLRVLDRDTAADVCVIGAGMTGLVTAYLLQRAGKSVIVLDDGGVASGESARTTAHLTCALDTGFAELIRLHGEETARLAASGHAAAIDLVERIARDEGIDCDFQRVDGFLVPARPDDARVIDAELDAASRLEIAGVERVEHPPAPRWNAGPSLRFPRQAQIHALRFFAGVALATVRAGGRLVRGHAAEIKGGANAHVITQDGRRVSADAIVVATHTPVNDRVEIHTKQAAYRTFAIAMEIRAESPLALLWDTADPYHYVRRHRDLLIVGGEDHKTGQEQADERFERLERWARERFDVGGVLHRWSGQVYEPVDGLAMIGRNPADDGNVLIATGFSGNGMTYGALAGVLVSDLALGRTNPCEKILDPARKTLGAAPEWVRENLNAFPKYADWLGGGDVASAEALAPGDAGIIRRGLHKVAACRDEDGTLHEVSAACPHLGGVVRWNALERTWDCPLHGSRFDAQGRVLCGPANRDLGPAAGGDRA